MHVNKGKITPNNILYPKSHSQPKQEKYIIITEGGNHIKIIKGQINKLSLNNHCNYIRI